ncbi:flagellar protein FlaG [Solibacillus sp. CAU 1738]|uniref:flagellar protein FlaG n=1 Tax=Solibacillus sp. CAU 1738 TaxID=3140363 RepID=UPI0032618CCD
MMRITSQSLVEQTTLTKTSHDIDSSTGKVVTQGSEDTTISSEKSQYVEVNDKNTSKIEQAVKTMNEVLNINHSTSKFVYHEGLGRYYITVVDSDSDEVVKEIPPKKLLDAFYEMQKMLGMIVDEKI